MRGPSSFPQILCHVLLLALAASSALAQQPQVVAQDARVLAPRVEASPQVQKAREQNTPVVVPLAPDAMRNKWLQCEKSAQDLQQQFEALQLQHTSLQQELQVVQQQLKEATHPGGSAVTAYCESPSISRNTAGATTDCGLYKCEPVSGLCRTQCNLSEQCNGVCNSSAHECIP